MEDWVVRILEEEKARRKEPLEVKKIGKNYYLYRSTTVWLKGKGKRKKISTYIGKIEREGLREGRKTKRYARSIYEYGNARLLMDIVADLIPPLREAFPDSYKEIIATSIVRTIQPSPLKSIKGRWNKLFLSREFSASLSPGTLSERLRLVGSNWDAQRKFFLHLLSNSRYLLFDLSSLVSYSDNLKLAERGYNSSHNYLRQVNFALIFSCQENIPVVLKAMPGSIRDIKSFKHIVREMNLKSCTVILDRGFSSYYLPFLLKEKDIRFILPLRRNLKIIDYDVGMDGCFVYRRRGINWGKMKIGDNFLYLFEDVELRAKEESTFIELIQQGKRKKENLLKEKKRFGKIAILSNISREGEDIYLLYKQREEVEVAFDAMKNELESDKLYLSDDDRVRGYFFISFLSLYIYFRILNILKKNGLSGKMSVGDLLFELSKVYLVYYTDGECRLSEIPAKVEKIDKLLKLNLFPKTLRS